MLKKSKFNVFTFMMLTILGLTFLPALSAHAACPEAISSYWKLDEAAGPYADFISDNVGTGNADPAATTDGIVNGAQEFSDANLTGIDVEPDNSFNWLQSESFSIEFWIKRNGALPDADPEVAIGRDDGDVDNELQWWVGIDSATGAAKFYLQDNNGIEEVQTLTGTKDITADNEWHHVVAIRDGENNQNLLYVDGTPEAFTDPATPVTYDRGFNSSTAKLNIGYLDSGLLYRLNGFLDEVALYNTVLTQQQITDHYASGTPATDYCAGVDPFVPFPDDTISLWKLDETAGPGYADDFGNNEGTGNANPTATTDGIVNGAQEFGDANLTGIDVEPDNSFNWLQSESFSIEFWIKRNGALPDADPEVAIGRDDGDVDNELQWWVGIDSATGAAKFYLQDNNGIEEVQTLTGTKDITADNEWHHVVAIRDGENNQNLLYVDGTPEAFTDPATPVTYDRGFNSSTAKLNIGYLDSGLLYRLNGFLDEVALYNTVLTQQQITDHYASGNGKGIETSRPAPSADAGSDQANVKETTGVTLDGGGSSIGYTGTTIAYLWEQTAGTDVGTINDASTATANFTAPDVAAAGETLTFQLTVTASDGQSDSDTVDIDVVDRIPPVADAGPDQDVTEGDLVTLDGTGSSDADGTIASYQWVETTTTGVALSDATSASPTFTAPQVTGAAVTVTFELTVTDSDGLPSTPDSVSVTVNDNSLAPTADAGADQTVAPGATVTLDGSASTPATGLTYAWIQTGGTTVQLAGDDTATPTFTAPTAADISAAVLDTLTFELTVTDAGGSNTDTVDVIVDDSVGRSSGGGGGGGCFINSMF